MERLAPPDLALDWDNAGLLLGSPAQDIQKIIVTLDTELDLVPQVDEKTLIISHHPLIFTPLKTIRTDLPQGELLAALIKKDAALYASHTSFDIAPGGINDILAAKLGLKNSMPLQHTSSEKLFKLVVFVPADHLAKVRSAMTDAGAGHLGNYSSCTFATAGTGTFLPLAGADPYIGEEGKLEYAAEERLETVVPEKLKRQVIAAMLEAHPYEEVAYDEILLENKGKSYGLGRIGDLKEPLSFDAFLDLVKSVLSVPHVKAACAAPNKQIKRVAVCGGSGASLSSYAAAQDADVFLTGDVKYHDAQSAAASGLAIIDAGHFATENIFVPHVKAYLQEQAAANNWDIVIEDRFGAKNIFTVY
jgi:dinuclear metal center YbgI/SA1388 family protein